MKKSNHKSSIHKWALAVLMIVSTSTVAIAQDDLPPGFPEDVDDETPAAPIDGFVGLALAAGACFGIKKLKKKDQ